MCNHINISSKAKMVIFLLFLIFFGLNTQSQTESTNSGNADKCQSPYFMVLSENSSAEQLPLKHTGVDVCIAGVIADVQVKQVYSNTGKVPLEAVYVFPASTRAAVYAMTMKIGEREIVAIIEEKDAARKQYNQAKQEGKKASLLEQQRPNVFTMNIANIMPGDTVEVMLFYTELLVPTDAVYEFVYPTVVGPRYVSGSEPESGTSENWTANPYLEEGVKAPSTLDIRLNINAGLNIKDIRCETHKNKIHYSSKSAAEVVLEDKNGGNRDFILKYRLAGNGIETGVLTFSDNNGENYFLAMIQPPQRINPEQIVPREYLFIVDVSGSMSGFPLDISKSMMRKLLESLKQTDKFNLVLFAGSSQVYAERPIEATKLNIDNAIRFIEKLQGGGGTELLEALQKAMQIESDPGYSRSFLILTDGYVNVEKEAFDFIHNNLGKANFFSFGIGSSVNRYIIEGMARTGCGEPFIATDREQGKMQAQKFIQYISSPVLTKIEYTVEGADEYEVLPTKIPDLFADRPLIIAGKFKGSNTGTIQIKGLSGGIPFESIPSLGQIIEKQDLQALKYLWAREKIRLLSDYELLGQDSERNGEIIALGKKYNLLTAYTSFIAIDTEVSNTTGTISTVKQPLPLPEGVSNMAVGNSGYLSKSMKPAPELSSFAYSAAEERIEDSYRESEVFFIVEQMPHFQGADLNQFQNYIHQNIQYPDSARVLGLEGKVFVRFSVDENGYVVDVEIIRGVDKLLDDEVLRVVRASPRWTPGTQRGKPVKVSFTIPVYFKLN